MILIMRKVISRCKFFKKSFKKSIAFFGSYSIDIKAIALICK